MAPGRGADRKGAGDGAWVYPACLKLIRIILETWYLLRKYTHIYVVSENMRSSTKALLILLMSVFFFFFLQKSIILGKTNTYTQATVNSVRAAWKVL